jgi:hypothetical protein
MRPFRFSLSLLVMALASQLAAQASPIPSSATAAPIVEMQPEAMRLLAQGQDALFEEDFKACEDAIRRAQATEPGHPLPAIFLQSMLIYQLQVEQKLGHDTRPIQARLEMAGDAAVASAEAYIQARPGPVAELYLGGALGTRGMGHLYEGSYVVAYRDGKKAYRLLQQCVAEEPQLFNAYVGLGTFEYESGRLASVLQYILNLHGDVDYGLDLLKTCEQRASYAAPSALMHLARIYTNEVPDPALSLLYLKKLCGRYPRNPSFAGWCADAARRAGWKSPTATELFEPVLDQWDQGWRPDRKRLDIPALRMEYAQALLRQGQHELARRQLAALAGADDPALAGQAKSLLKDLP